MYSTNFNPAPTRRGKGETMLINCNTTKIPLRDKSVHCVPTSPPYFDLRSYDLPPQVWGGRAGCNHVWGEEIFSSGQSGGDGKTSGLNAKFDDDGVFDGKSSIKHPPQSNQFCQRPGDWRKLGAGRCNAWRGSLGNEPLHDCERPFLELRDNLTQKEQDYVMAELKKLGLVE